MGKYTQPEEIEIIRDAMTLTTAIQIEQEELNRLKSERFKTLPAAPTRKVLNVPQIQPQVPPPPKTQYSYSNYLSDSLRHFKSWIREKLKFVVIVGAVVLILLIVIGISIGKVTNSGGFLLFQLISSIFGLVFPLTGILFIVSMVKFSKKKKDMNLQLAHSAEYLKAVEEAKRLAAEQQQKAQDEVAQQQAQLDAKHKSDMEHYNTVTVPTYNKELAHWKETQAKKIAMLEDDLKINAETLTNLYETTKLVSLTYRELWILRWLYDDMRSSDYDVRYATELLDRDRQRLVTEQSGRIVREAVNDMHSSMISGFHAVYEAVEDGNEELAKMRRDQNRANVVGIIQRHNLNKMTKAQNEMLDQHFNKK
ncbi:ABC transporter permease [Candidatus Soleaferrea massiliensis]|uniref:ABC transporter permease n=1 Tax=Candidatus Soleaferrea massiliensis TaxID=1470354 RepID=UPI00059055C9|nr:ABC transporter permease [Candidatus Soleaferrea massiliensis]